MIAVRISSFLDFLCKCVRVYGGDGCGGGQGGSKRKKKTFSLYKSSEIIKAHTTANLHRGWGWGASHHTDSSCTIINYIVYSYVSWEYSLRGVLLRKYANLGIRVNFLFVCVLVFSYSSDKARELLFFFFLLLPPPSLLIVRSGPPLRALGLASDKLRRSGGSAKVRPIGVETPKLERERSDFGLFLGGTGCCDTFFSFLVFVAVPSWRLSGVS